MIYTKPFYEIRDTVLFAGRMPVDPFPLHMHEIVEILCLESGKLTMQIEQEHYNLQPGDMAVVFPFTTHSYVDVSEDLCGFALFIMPGEIHEFSRLFMEYRPTCPILPVKEVPAEISLAIEHLTSSSPEQPDPHRLGWVHLMLSYAINALDLSCVGHRTECSLAFRVIQFINDHACEPLTLQSVAEALSVNPYYLSHMIAGQLKTNLRQMINSVRINKALSLMREPGHTLTEIAEQCGYENTRTFRRAFLSETGSLPSDYVKKTFS